jgi:hypothetical protein
MFKFINSIFAHIHCFCDKKLDFYNNKGERVIIMACNKCGLEEIHTIKEKDGINNDKIRF